MNSPHCSVLFFGRKASSPTTLKSRMKNCPPVAPDQVTYERRGPAAVLTIDRQDRRNAVDGPTADALAEGYERFEDDDEARVLILTGAGGVAFCAGADLKAIDTLGPRLLMSGGPLGFTRRIATKPTIAAISG